MVEGKDPYRARDLSALIAPDRRREHAALLVATSMIAGGLLVLFAERVVESMDDPLPPSRTPHVVEDDRTPGDDSTRPRSWSLRELLNPRHNPRAYSGGSYDPGAHM